MLKKLLVVWSIVFILFGLLSCGSSSSGKSTVTQTTPKFISKSEVTVEENQPYAIRLIAENYDKEKIIYGISEGDFESFYVDDLSGEVRFKTLPKYEEKSIYKFVAYAKYTAMEPITQPVTIKIAKKGALKELKFTSPSSLSVYENQTDAIVLKAEGNGKIVYSISGDDAEDFNVNSSTGVVTFKVAPDYESQTSYHFIATAKDNSNEATQNITISIKDRDESTDGTVNTPIVESDYFITTWKTDNNGSSNDNQIMIETYPYSGYKYDFNIDWGDGSSDTHVTKSITHTYSTVGVYTVKISGDFPRMESNGYSWSSKTFKGDAEKLLSIDQWGTIKWESMFRAFSGCLNMVGKFTDTPDLSRVKNMSLMFYRAEKFNAYIGNWDVSNVTDMEAVFNVARLFNQDISSWDVSNVINMSAMFAIAKSFNQDISRWDVSNVVNMNGMFNGTYEFNQDISSWDVSQVTNMRGMFSYSQKFNKNISSWDVSKVENMKEMFIGASKFNQDLSSWNISSIKIITTEYEYSTSKGMDNMFTNSALSTTNYNKILNGWSSQTVHKGLELGVGSIKYGTGGESGRNRLINDFGWTIKDGGKE